MRPKGQAWPSSLLATGLGLRIRRRPGLDLKESAWERVGKTRGCLLLKEEKEPGVWLQTVSLPETLRCHVRPVEVPAEPVVPPPGSPAPHPPAARDFSFGLGGAGRKGDDFYRGTRNNGQVSGSPCCWGDSQGWVIVGEQGREAPEEFSVSARDAGQRQAVGMVMRQEQRQQQGKEQAQGGK